jgi:hypothetical protein
MLVMNQHHLRLLLARPQASVKSHTVNPPRQVSLSDRTIQHILEIRCQPFDNMPHIVSIDYNQMLTPHQFQTLINLQRYEKSD